MCAVMWIIKRLAEEVLKKYPSDLKTGSCTSEIDMT